MLYISKILASNGAKQDSICSDFLEDFSEFTLFVSENGIERAVTARDILNSRCFGFSNNGDWYGAVVNSTKTIQIHRYVRGAVTVPGTGYIDFQDKDISILQAGNTVNNCGVVGKDSIAVNTGLLAVNLYGILGSCACKRHRHDTRPELFTLYDILGWLCKRTGLNVMRYNQIQLYSRGWNCTTTLDLVHSIEANRFFTKMYMDVMSR